MIHHREYGYFVARLVPTDVMQSQQPVVKNAFLGCS